LLEMSRVLITGMSGTGKSTALAELARRGHRVVDADLSAWSIEVTSPTGSGAEQLWRQDAMDSLLARHAIGKHAHEQQRILADLKAVEPLLRATSTVEIVTTIPVTEVADALESIARRADDGTAGCFRHP
jgi:dephospho-CoA kinase